MAGPDAFLGITISHFRMLEKLGRGGMGVVHKAEDIRLHHLVALKFLSGELAHDRAAFERFRREAEAFGVVLYEMTTGQLAFKGATSGIVTEAILNRAPEPLRHLVQYDVDCGTAFAGSA
jgi:hypothetical protein